MIHRVLLVDDEPLARERLVSLVRDVAPQADCREAGDGPAAVEAIRAWAPQVVFPDVQMPGLDGFEVLEEVGVANMPLTVFATAFDEHAMRAFDAAAVDYLLKPFDAARFAAAWHRVAQLHAAAVLTQEARGIPTSAVESLGALLAASRAASRGATSGAEPSRGHLSRLLVRRGERTIIVPVRDVRWMRSDGNYVELHTGQGTELLRETLAQLEARLDPARFVRIHRRVIVAIDHVRELQPWFGGDQVLYLKDGTKLKVSRTRREAVASRLAGLA